MSEARFLLLQARREDDPERDGERRLFARRMGAPEASVVGHNLLEGLPELRAIRDFQGLLIGGSGEYYVTKENLPRQEEVLDLLREAVEGPTPVFASCFGFHLLTAALGGTLLHDPDNMEIGTYELELTGAGAADELFGVLPSRFWAQVGRKDRASELPPGTSNFARSALCPNQGFRFGERQVWASQFHPELDGETNRGRYLAYLEGYAEMMSEQERRDVLERFRDSPETPRLLRRFYEIVTD